MSSQSGEICWSFAADNKKELRERVPSKRDRLLFLNPRFAASVYFLVNLLMMSLVKRFITGTNLLIINILRLCGWITTVKILLALYPNHAQLHLSIVFHYGFVDKCSNPPIFPTPPKTHYNVMIITTLSTDVCDFLLHQRVHLRVPKDLTIWSLGQKIMFIICISISSVVTIILSFLVLFFYISSSAQITYSVSCIILLIAGGTMWMVICVLYRSVTMLNKYYVLCIILVNL